MKIFKKVCSKNSEHYVQNCIKLSEETIVFGYLGVGDQKRKLTHVQLNFVEASDRGYLKRNTVISE